MSGVPFTSFSTNSISSFESSVFRVLWQRRLWLSLPPSTRCRCGRLLDVRGRHRAACAVVGVLGRRGFPVARVCQEAGARVSANVMVRDLDILLLDRQDGRKLEVVADGLPLVHWHSWRSTPPWCRRCEQMGLLAQAAMSMMAQPFVRPEETHPEFTGEVGRARLVVLATEVGGRWSEETQMFLRLLAKAKARAEPVPLQVQVRAVWLHRWRTVLACCRSLGMSLLEIRGGLGSDGPTLPPRRRSWQNSVRPGLLRDATGVVRMRDSLY